MQHAETKHEALRATVFGEVLAELLEARELSVRPFTVGKLAEDASLDAVLCEIDEKFPALAWTASRTLAVQLPRQNLTLPGALDQRPQV
jgi:hypothetical protein